MMMACFTGHVNVAITLKQHGASFSVKDQGGIYIPRIIHGADYRKEMI